MKRMVAYDFLIPLLVLWCLTMAFWLTDADIALQKAFYSTDKGWYLRNSNPWKLLYDYGNIPGLLLGAASLIVVALGFAKGKALRYRKIALFLVVLLALGPGLITYAVFKDHWGRPRPGNVEIFGGKEKFLPVWVRGGPGAGKSFPSGHASIGFYLFAPFFFLRRCAKGWASFFLALGIGYGVFMGIGRMAQGGHFASDIVWAGGFTYITGLLLFYIFRFDRGIWWP
jgi:lipid A 4'-phosphatase